jgi:hypothetical protein
MFDLARFRKLIAATWLENRRAWAWFLGVGIIVHFVFCLLVLVSDGHDTFSAAGQGAVWIIGLYLTGVIFAGRYFSAMARRESALVLLMRPASTFEKWLLAILVVAVLYPVAYTIAFQVCNAPAWAIARSIEAAEVAANAAAAANDPAEALLQTDFSYFMPWDIFERPSIWYVAMVGWLGTLQAFAMLGSLYFRAFPFIKTILAGFLTLLFLMLANAVIGGTPALFFNYWEHEQTLSAWQQVFFPVAWIAIPALMWLASLFALREREVA